MKTHIVSAATPAILAIAAILLSFRYVNADALLTGLFSVAGVATVMALEYRGEWKRQSNR
jgi:hypothetical protein